MPSETRNNKLLNVSETSGKENDKCSLILKKIDDLTKVIHSQTQLIKQQSGIIENQNKRIDLLERTIHLVKVENENLNKTVSDLMHKSGSNIEKTAEVEVKNNDALDNADKKTGGFVADQKIFDKTGEKTEGFATAQKILVDTEVVKNNGSQYKNKNNHSSKDLVRGTADVNSFNFAAVCRMAWLYVGKVKNETKAEDITNFLNKRFPDATVKVEEIKKHENNTSRSKSFKVGLDYSYLNEVQKPEVWPRDIIVRKFRFFQLKTKEGNINSENKPVSHTVKT